MPTCSETSSPITKGVFLKKVFLAGGLAKDVEVRSAGETSVANFDLAVTEYNYKTKENETCWVPVAVWGSTADFLGRNAKKGDRLVVIGELTYETWDSKKYTDDQGQPCVMKKAVVKADMQGGVEWIKNQKNAGGERTLADMAKNPTKEDMKDIDFRDEEIPF